MINVNRLTYTRRATKLWTHVTISSPEITLVANFSVVASTQGPSHRLTTLVFAEPIVGHVRTFPATACRPAAGGAGFQFEASRIVETRAGFELVIDEPTLALHAELHLRALASRSVLHNLGIGNAGALHWEVVPRLLANGTIARGGTVYEIAEVPAYRDCNWGTFEFGDITWDWGYVLPNHDECPFAVVFARLMDSRRTTVLDQHVLVWSGKSLLGSFRGADLAFTAIGRASGPFLTVPPVLALCRPGHASDVPERLIVTASSSRGALRIELARAATARMIIPNDCGLGTTIIHESLAKATAAGSIDDFELAFSGHSFIEAVYA